MGLPFRKGNKREHPDDESSIGYVFRKLDEVKRELEEEEKERYAVVGLGNDLKGDDGVGWYVVSKLEKTIGQKDDIYFIKTSVPEDHVSEVRDFSPDVVIIIDSADFNGSPGDIRLIGEGEVARTIGGTHTTPVTLFMNLLLKDFEHFAPRIVLIGIQRKQAEFGMPMSKEVKKSGDRIAKLIEKLYREGMLGGIEREVEIIASKNPLKRIGDIVEKIAEAGKGKEQFTS